jgi:hypothetical protein
MAFKRLEVQLEVLGASARVDTSRTRFGIGHWPYELSLPGGSLLITNISTVVFEEGDLLA